MTNLTIISICLAVFSVCCVIGVILLIISDFRKKELNECKLRRIVMKLQELEDSPSCGPRFNNEPYVSVKWLLNFIEEGKDENK